MSLETCEAMDIVDRLNEEHDKALEENALMREEIKKLKNENKDLKEVCRRQKREIDRFELEEECDNLKRIFCRDDAGNWFDVQETLEGQVEFKTFITKYKTIGPCYSDDYFKKILDWFDLDD